MSPNAQKDSFFFTKIIQKHNKKASCLCSGKIVGDIFNKNQLHVLMGCGAKNRGENATSCFCGR
jgi:hypothetical protein